MPQVQVQRCRCSSADIEVQRRCRRGCAEKVQGAAGAKVARCRGAPGAGVEVHQRGRGTDVQMCRGTEVQVQRSSDAELQSCRGAEVQRC